MNWVDEIEYWGEIGARALEQESADIQWREWIEGQA